MAHHTNVNVSVGGPTIIVAQAGNSVPLIARVMWYLFIGWWFAPLVMIAGYLLTITIVGIPLAFALFNKVPQALTLRPRTQTLRVNANGGVTTLSHEHNAQLPMWQRALYFLFVGSWLGWIWIALAYVIGLGVITFPLTLWMLDRIGGVMTLHRH
jgi:uncharacterized membrane protein YccF (DUF307 family)